MTSSLEQLKRCTTVVADTGDFEALKLYKPVDATTNPSLLLTAAKLPKYAHLVADAIDWARKSTDATIEKARKLISLYKDLGIDKDRVLIKIASTYEGIEAAARLEKDHGIHCNLTLLFNLMQAVACAEAGVTLISPFVGRILDWHKKNRGFSSPIASEDPGVVSVCRIYEYLKKYDYRTKVMGASFRSVNEILELAGIDYLTISPALLEELSELKTSVACKLNAEAAKKSSVEKIAKPDKHAFEEAMGLDDASSELLKAGIAKFDEDGALLRKWLETML